MFCGLRIFIFTWWTYPLTQWQKGIFAYGHCPGLWSNLPFICAASLFWAASNSIWSEETEGERDAKQEPDKKNESGDVKYEDKMIKQVSCRPVLVLLLNKSKCQLDKYLFSAVHWVHLHEKQDSCIGIGICFKAYKVELHTSIDSLSAFIIICNCFD